MSRQPLVQHQKLVVKSLYAETFQLLKPVWDDFVVPLQLAGRRGNSDPTWTQLGTSPLYLPGFKAAGVDEVFFEIQVPHSQAHGSKYNANLDRYNQMQNHLGLHIHWIPSTTNVGGVLWGLNYWVSKRGTAYADASVATAKVSPASSGVITEQIDTLANIPATEIVDSTCIVFRLFRDGDDDLDTFTGVALGISVDAHILRDSLGSNEEFGDDG